MSGPDQYMLAVIEELREENGGRMPGVKRLANALSITVNEAKELLDSVKDVEAASAKKAKATPAPEAMVLASASETEKSERPAPAPSAAARTPVPLEEPETVPETSDP